MENVENRTTHTKKEKKGIKCFNSLLKINEYSFDRDLREFKQRAAKNHYNESFIFDRVREDCMTFSNQMIGAINVLQMTELITAQESENMLKKVQEQAEIIKNRYFPPAECNKEQEVCFAYCDTLEEAKRSAGENAVSLSKVKGEDKMKEVKEEKSYARFDLMTSYHYHQDNEAVSKALYNVNFDAMDKEPAIVQDVFRTIAEGKDGTFTEVREKDMYWDTRTIGIYCGEEEYLIKATRLADEDNRNEYSTFISVAAPQKELDVFTKKIKNVFEQNHVHGVNVITESKDVSKGYLKSKFDSDKHVLTTDEQKLTMPVKLLGFTKEQMALVQYVMVDEKNKNKTVSDGSNSPVSLNLSNQKPVETLQLGGTGAKKSKRKM